ncbi:uncharacterized protein LOC128186204 [Crassostrea angulata]|uniref:uncharacterized protein LOC128186204 n=1 Tax=Magallana angulata TaxID=2784310 RepID=UPI0022B1107F|nr:uncharacterized protein LOC128186204 [Crassostrea angulata]
MPIIEKSQVFDSRDEIDECFLVRRLSLYATIRPEDIKSLGADPGLTKTPRGSRRSLQDLFRPARDLHHDLAITEERVYDDTPVIDGRGFPIQYKSAGIKPHEIPVIGFHVDESICPGFRYRVRYMGSKDFLFNGEPRMLQSIGLGYGKRLTFSGETLNNNENYFWSDSRPEGYAFTVCAVEAGDKFVIYDEMSRVVGDVDIIEVYESQTEEKTVYEPDYVTKIVRVRLTANIQYHIHHGMLMDVTDHVTNLEGTAVLVRHRGSMAATLQQISDVNVPRFGKCSLWKE